MKIAIFTANVQGGILQFTIKLFKVLSEEGHEPILFLPYEIKDCDLSSIDPEKIKQYKKEKKVINQKPYKDLANQINQINPDYVWYTDNSVICSCVGIWIDRKIKQLLTLHDAGTKHLSNNNSLRMKLLGCYEKLMDSFFYHRIDKFIILSPESNNTFSRIMPKYAHKSVLLPLGAHMPDVVARMPEEMKAIKEKKYLLFFGRIDAYKGVGNLLLAYKDVSGESFPLVIAGNGRFSTEEEKLLQEAKNVILIHRYIHDDEMKWLFENCTCVALPYIEATQSGVIPLAYLCRKPVLVSDVRGLTQFVEDKSTGYICSSIEDWQKHIMVLSRKVPEPISENIVTYYHANLDWNQNIKRLFDVL